MQLIRAYVGETWGQAGSCSSLDPHVILGLQLVKISDDSVN